MSSAARLQLLQLLLLQLSLLPQLLLAQCNPSSSTVDTRIQVATDAGSGTNCFFPFIDGGVTYNDCKLGGTGRSWCATTCNYPGFTSEWRYCIFTVADLGKTNCSGLATQTTFSEPELYGGKGSGSQCYFPFLYKGACHYDCITETTEPFCATTNVPDDVQIANNFKFCRYTRRGIADASCASLSSTAPIYLPPQLGSYGITPLSQPDQNNNCTFPFYYGDRCYSDCTTDGAIRWYVPWCSTEMYTQPNEKTRVCPYYHSFRTITTLPMQWGFYRVMLQDGCSIGASVCNMSWTRADSSVPNGFFGNPRMALSSSSAVVIEVMPQPNGFFVLRIPLVCTTNWDVVSLDSTQVTYESIQNEREFWQIKSTSTANVYTVQSTWNATQGQYISRSLESGNLLMALSASVAEWRFVPLTEAEKASLGLPCGEPIISTTTTTTATTAAPTDGSWCAWSNYVVTGTIGTRKRNCSCPAATTGTCPGSDTDSGTVVNGTWCEWSGYTVNGAYGTRLRDCNCSAPAYGGVTCSGSNNDTGLVVNGTWCSWSGFTVTSGYATRLRECNCSGNAYGGVGCSGVGNDTGAVVDGNWCEWSSYTVTAGVGTRQRSCNCSAPAYTGANCSGSSSESLTQVNGVWCSWSELQSEYGFLRRTRACNCPAPNVIGINCTGSTFEDYACNISSCMTTTAAAVAGQWCNWDSWLPGNVNSGIMTRTRSCDCPAATGGGAACSGSADEQGICTIAGCAKIYAEPREAGGAGTEFHQSGMFNKLIIWGTVTSVCIAAAGAVGVGLMLKQAKDNVA